MNDAAVGFQCPSCVADGRKQTRQGRTAYGGSVAHKPGMVTNILIGINVAVWVAITSTGGGRSWLVDVLALSNRGICYANPERTQYRPGIHEGAACAAVNGDWYPGFADGAAWQALTSAFTHVQVWHIAMNMFALFFMGPALEAMLGRWRYLALYLLSALGGSVLVLVTGRGAVGASGAIFGLLAAHLVVAIKVRGNVSGVVQLLVINGFISIAGASYISWEGHLGGFLAGLAAAFVLVYAPREKRTQWQVAGLGLVTVVIGALLAVLA
jgi:membrane associated rhomboid family serine protease